MEAGQDNVKICRIVMKSLRRHIKLIKFYHTTREYINFQCNNLVLCVKTFEKSTSNLIDRVAG